MTKKLALNSVEKIRVYEMDAVELSRACKITANFYLNNDRRYYNLKTLIDSLKIKQFKCYRHIQKMRKNEQLKRLDKGIVDTIRKAGNATV